MTRPNTHPFPCASPAARTVFGPLAALALALAGCGGAGSDQLVASDARSGFRSLTELEGSYRSLAITDADGAVAVVTGISNGEPRPELTWIADANAQPIRAEVPADVALYDLGVWWTGEEVMVLGLECPKWTLAEEEPEWSEDLLAQAIPACGSNQYVLSGWNPSTAE